MRRTVFLTVMTTAFAWSFCQQDAHAETLQIIRSIDLPRESVHSYDLTWDGQHLWTSMISGRGIVWNRTLELDPLDGSVISSFEYNGDLNRTGHAWDGAYLWIGTFLALGDNVLYGTPPDESPDYVYKFATDGTLISTFSPPHGPDAITTGATWDGTFLWLSDSKHREIVQVDVADMTVITSFSSPGTAPRGLTWAWNSLWSVDGADDLIYQLDISGNILETWAAPGSDPYGITFDGQYLWVLDNDAHKVFQLAVPEPGSLALLAVGAAGMLAVLLSRRKARWQRIPDSGFRGHEPILANWAGFKLPKQPKSVRVPGTPNTFRNLKNLGGNSRRGDTMLSPLCARVLVTGRGCLFDFGRIVRRSVYFRRSNQCRC